MCRENTDMRWQFGGNFQPVRVICEENWKECSIAVLNYVWSEIVTEVVDCLSNDILVWRIIAMAVVFIILIHTVYYKLRWIDETSVNKENLNRVGFKVQDLELKVNILTYKMQYGTWPLPHHMRKSDVGNELHNVRLTLSNSENRNSWIKHLLLSPRKNKDFNLCNKNLSHSIKSMTKLINLETKYASSKFQNEISPIEFEDKNIKDDSEYPTRKWKRCKKCFDITLSKQRQISKSENLGLRRRQSPKSICLSKKEKNNFQMMKSNYDSNEMLIERKKLQGTKKIEERTQIQAQNQALSQNSDAQEQELSESYSVSSNTCSDKNVYEENQFEKDSSDPSEESDINCNTKMENETRFKKVMDPEMDSLTKTESNLEVDIDNMNSTNKIQPSHKSTVDTFNSWKYYDNVENTPKNETSNILPPSLNITFLTESLPKLCMDNPTKSVLEVSEQPYSLTNTPETLQQVREKLESLHNVLLAYDSMDSNKNESNSIFKDCILYKDAKSKKSSKVSFNMDIKENLIAEEDILNSSEYEQCESIIRSSSSSLSVQSYSNIFNIHREVVVHNPNHNRFEVSDSETESEKTQSELENSSNVSINTFTKILIESKENLSELKSDFASNSYHVNLNLDRNTMSQNQSHSQNYITDNRTMENYLPMDTSEDQISQSSSQVEFSNDENSDNQSTSALLQEALQFKDALVSQLEWEKDLKMKQRNIIKEKEEELDYRKNSWPIVDNYFQTKVLDIITEEQSASSSTEKTSKTFVKLKMSEEQVFPHQRMEENSKSPLASTSSEYFSFSNSSQSDKVPKESGIGSDEENKNESQTQFHSLNNKRVMNREVSSNELIKRSKYMTEKEIKRELNEMENFENSEKELKENKKEQESEVQRVEEHNSNEFSPIMESSSHESLMQFIRELANDKVKAAKIFRETKLNSAKSEEKTSDENEAQKQESTLILQRRPGSFSITENESEEKSFNSNIQETSKMIFSEIDADFQTREKGEECDFGEMKDTIDKDTNKGLNSCENIDTGTNFELNDSEFSLRSEISVNNRSTDGSFEDERIKEKNSEKSTIEVSEKKSEFCLNEGIFESANSQEKIDESQSNLISNPSTSLYFPTETSNSDIKLNDEYLTSSTSISKANFEVQETIFEDLNEQLSSKNKICENNHEKQNEESKEKEVMLIDLSDDDNCRKRSEIGKPEQFRKIYNENINAQIENLNILDAVLAEKVKENICLVPKKIELMNKSETTFAETKDEDLLNENKINFIEKSLANLPDKIRISEINKFSHCPSAPWIGKKTSTLSTSVKSKQKVEVIKSKSPVKRACSTEKSVENSKETCKKNDKNSSTECKEKQLSLGKDSSSEQLQKRSRSFVSPRIMQTSPRSPHNLHGDEGMKSAREFVKNPMEMDQQISLTSRTSIKSAESQKSSRSCIPILKTRLENIRKTEHRSRPRSPMRGPLTISPRPDKSDLKDVRDFNARKEEKEEENICNEKSFGDNTGTEINLLKTQAQGLKDKTVIYINIMTDHDQSKRKVVDPKKFLEFVKDRELKIHNVVRKEKDVTDSEQKIPPKRNFQSKFSIQVEQKEREVSVKPSVMDNSTSISDFPEFCDDGKQNKGKYKIFQVPEELTKEEYIDLLDSLNQDPNLEQLSKMHKLCSKLGLGFQE